MGEGSVASFRWSADRRVSLRERVTFWEQEVSRLTAEDAQVRKQLARALREYADAKELLGKSQRKIVEYAEDT